MSKRRWRTRRNPADGIGRKTAFSHLLVLASALLAGCAPAPQRADAPKSEVAAEDRSGQTVEELRSLSRRAEELLKGGKPDQAAALVTQGQPLAARLLSVPRPSLAAMEAASDLDHLYGRMLLNNRHYGWARMQFQKNLARWKGWNPATPETARRVQQARSAIAECDRRMTQ